MNGKQRKIVKPLFWDLRQSHLSLILVQFLINISSLSEWSLGGPSLSSTKPVILSSIGCCANIRENFAQCHKKSKGSILNRSQIFQFTNSFIWKNIFFLNSTQSLSSLSQPKKENPVCNLWSRFDFSETMWVISCPLIISKWQSCFIDQSLLLMISIYFVCLGLRKINGKCHSRIWAWKWICRRQMIASVEGGGMFSWAFCLFPSSSCRFPALACRWNWCNNMVGWKSHGLT